MLRPIRASIVILLLMTVLTGLAYPLAMTAIAGAVLPGQAAGSLIVRDGKVIGSSLIGQNFTEDRYFQGRLSATSDTADVSPDRFPPLTEGEADLVPHSWEGATGYLQAVSWRRQRELDNGSAVVWLTPLANLVDTEEMTQMQRLALVADCANGAGAVIDPAVFVFMNTDTTMHLHRVPVGNDFALRARGSIGSDGMGVTTAEIFDRQGFIGTCAQTLFVQRRPEPI